MVRRRREHHERGQPAARAASQAALRDPSIDGFRMRIHSSALMKGRSGVALAICLFLSTGWAVANSPPFIAGDGPERIETRSQKFFAEPSSDGKSLVVYRRTQAAPMAIWRRPGWVDNGFLSDDGEYLVTGWYRSNLLDPDYAREMTMLVFYRREQLIASVSLGELIRDMKSLESTDSYPEWGAYDGFVAEHTFCVRTVEGRTLFFDVTTGKLVREEKNKDFRRPRKAGSGARDGTKNRAGSARQNHSERN